ncbi:von Willebrand factor A domain-containing protein 5A [Trichoderma ghanense]|uniref:von Willebrand factor A domain-containing protein 5A n=1 Tax=Trichoderma ghanense TaxID=65468 RepID=A0ABY2GSZ8_9HYPO
MWQHPLPRPIMPSCGIYCNDNGIKFLPIVSLDVHTSILASSSRTVLKQTFATTGRLLKNVRYAFPLYDGSSVVGFQCTVGSRIIKGVVKERNEAKQAYDAALAQGKAAGLLEQSLEASDVFVTSLGNIPPGCQSVDVEVTYLGELKHDAQVDGLRFTIPNSLAQRYGQHSITGSDALTFQGGKHIKITVDVDISSGSVIKSIQSPSHPISVNIGTLSTAPSDTPSLQRAHATLAQEALVLGNDFVLQLVATGLGDPIAILENHPTIPNQRALMTTLVPRFNLPMEMAEIVFVCDRSGSMGEGNKMGNVIEALNIFLKSLPVGVRFNICSFGSDFSFLWERSMTYDQATLDAAIRHVVDFGADLGGTEMYAPIREIFQRRYKDLNLEVFLLTDGEIWDQERLFQLINTHVAESKGAIRIFTLGVGKDASHALIEGVARAGNGFAQVVAENEKMDKMLVRMLKGALTPHITDYSLEVKYGGSEAASDEETDGDEFVVIERVMDAMTLDISPSSETAAEPDRTISLFDQSVQDSDMEIPTASNSVSTKLLPVPVPRYLQAPFQIPSLLPFSRTTVYVLLSDATPGRQPKSVILRGSSAHGPVELEIPVRTLTESSTTIHQLAARKAVRELVDGRGWIFHVKTKDGKLLQEQLEGRFSDMVKREAVRLGTQYQVSGKWCSFVAIQRADGDDVANTGQENAEPEKGDDDHGGGDEEDISFDDIVQQQTSAHVSSHPVAGRMRKRKMVRSIEALEDEPPFAQQSPMSHGSRLQGIPTNYAAGMPRRQGMHMHGASAYQSHGMAGRPIVPPQMSMPYNVQLQIIAAQQMMQHQQAAAAAAMTGINGNNDAQTANLRASLAAQRAAAAQQAASAQLHQQYQQQHQAIYERFQQQRQQMQLGSPSLHTNHPMGVAPDQGSASYSNPNALFGSASTSPSPLCVLTALQTFVGSWYWDSMLEAALGITAELAADRVQLPGDQSTQRTEVLATLCAVVFVKKKLASEKESWELLVKKAEDWLQQQMGADLVEWEKNVEDKLFAE